MTPPTVKGPGGLFMTAEQKAAAEAMHVPTEVPAGKIPDDVRAMAAGLAAIHNTTVRVLRFDGGIDWSVLFPTDAEVAFKGSAPLPPPIDHPNIGDTAELAAWQNATATVLGPTPEPAAPAAPDTATAPAEPTSPGGTMTEVTPTTSAPASTAPKSPSVISEVETLLGDALTGLKDIEANDVPGAITQLIAFLEFAAAMLRIKL